VSEFFPLIKHIHVWCVTLSFCLFVLRLILLQRGKSILQRRSLKIGPHVIDTVLLASGIYLAISLRYTPSAIPWFGIKLALVVCYITCGLVAFKKPKLRLIFSILALLCFFGAAYLAINKPLFS
jgi:uncharacterized membrane protein SirB2